MNLGQWTLHSEGSLHAVSMPGMPAYMARHASLGMDNDAFQAEETSFSEAVPRSTSAETNKYDINFDLTLYKFISCPEGPQSVLHAFWKAVKLQDALIKLASVQDAFCAEVSYNYSLYTSHFNDITKPAAQAKVAKFLDEGLYDDDVCHAAPYVLANAFNVDACIYQLESAETEPFKAVGREDITGRSTPTGNRTVHLARVDEQHYFYSWGPSNTTLPNGKAHSDAGNSVVTEEETESVPPEVTEDIGDQADFRDEPESDKMAWDVFRMVDADPYHASADLCWMTVRKVFRVVTLVFTFLFVLSSGVTSKLMLLFITTNMAAMFKYGEPTCTCNQQEQTCTMNFIESQNKNQGEPFSTNVTMQWAWSLVFVIITPYVFTFLKCLWNILGCKAPRWYGCNFLLGVLLIELVHSTGVVLLTTLVLPALDLLWGSALLLGVGAIPAALKMFSHNEDYMTLKWPKIALDVCMFVLQLSIPVVFIMNASGVIVYKNTVLQPHAANNAHQLHAALCVSVLLISVRWWPNYVNRFTSCFEKLSEFNNGVNTNVFNTKIGTAEQRVSYKKKSNRTNYLLHLIISLWKTVLTVVGVVGLVALQTGSTNIFPTPYMSEHCNEKPKVDDEDFQEPIQMPIDYSPFVIYGIQAGCGIVCYFVGLHACKVQLQKWGFALPLFFVTPVSAAIICILSTLPSDDPFIEFLTVSGIRLHITMPSTTTEMVILILCMLLWWLSQARVASHVWFPRISRIAASERIFLLPMFDAEMLEQSLLYNRRNDFDTEKTNQEVRLEKLRRGSGVSNARLSMVSLGDGALAQFDDLGMRNPNTEFIYLCATMWHESEDEMKQILKSIYRLDSDQNWRRNAQEFFNISDPDYYEFEAHIFFDDAFTDHFISGEKYSANHYVKQLVRTVPTAAKSVHKRNIKILDPVRIPTPYGGRLEWTLPGGNRLIAHLKDKAKIRHKKRWSQVMYMYYFLGHQIIANDNYDSRQKERMAKKTYLLALDGDVDFQPQAVQLLVDMMKRNEDVGATCGRIHPIGSGLIVWYQRFEYAVSHWLQKATEHILGCVLCSPGCFSMFRGSALMDDNVMRRYATPSTEASHYLQYDQGEDRWLCTLLLQQGYRVEYNAAADALTNAPEGFDEFYNQRRRWGPSTMANIVDLLMDVKHVVSVNRYMSFLYIAYQATMFFASLLGPGTIFLMITGALAIVLRQGDDLPFILNTIAIGFYMIISYFTTSNFQIKVASLLSALYSIVMGLVFVTVLIELNANPCSSSSIFFFIVAGTFVLAALLHPQEIRELIYGLVYYLLIPCMYLFLIIYSMVNMNNVSWGTREVKATTAVVPQAKVETQKPQTLQGMLTALIKRSDATDNDEGATYSCGSTCKVVCCPRPNKAEENRWLLITNQLQKLSNQMKNMSTSVRRIQRARDRDEEDSFDSDNESSALKSDAEGMPSSPLLPTPTSPTLPAAATTDLPEKKLAEIEPAKMAAPVELRDDLRNPYWLEEPEMLNGPVEVMQEVERTFWDQLIETYLKPLDNNPEKQKKIAEQLLELRNKVTFAFFLANVMFVIIIFALQKQKENISIMWPCEKDGKKELLDPIGFILLVFFMAIMVLQVIGMLFHRLGTFFHIMAATTLTFCTRLTKDGKDKEETDETARAILLLAQNIGAASKKDPDGSLSETEFGQIERKQTKLVRNILEKVEEPVVISLDEEFKKTIEDIGVELEAENLTEHNLLLHNLPPGQKRATINFLRDQKTMSSIKRRLSQASRRDQHGRHLSSASATLPSNRRRKTSTLSVASAPHDGEAEGSRLQRHRASVAFEDENSNILRCHTIPNVRHYESNDESVSVHALETRDMYTLKEEDSSDEEKGPGTSL